MCTDCTEQGARQEKAMLSCARPSGFHPLPKAGSRGSEEKQDQYSTKARRVNTSCAFYIFVMKCVCSTYTVCRLVPGERTVCKQLVPSGRSGYPCLNRSLPTSHQRQRHQPVATVTSPKLAEAPPSPGVTNASCVCLQHPGPGQAAVPLRPGGSPSGTYWEETVPPGKPQVLHLPQKVVLGHGLGAAGNTDPLLQSVLSRGWAQM